MKKDGKRKSLLFWLTLVSVLCIGEVLGAWSARNLPGETFQQTEGFLMEAIGAPGLEDKKVFLSNLAEKLKWVIGFYLTGFFRWTVPIPFLLLGLKGYILGFSATFLLLRGSFPLFWYLILPSVILELPCLFAMVRLGNRHAMRRSRETHIEKRRDLCRTYTVAMAVLFLVLIGESLLESWILPAILT